MEVGDPRLVDNPLSWGKPPVYIISYSHPTCHINDDEIKMRDDKDRRLPHLRGLPHLPGVHDLHVNRPYVKDYHLTTVTCNSNYNY